MIPANRVMYIARGRHGIPPCGVFHPSRESTAEPHSSFDLMRRVMLSILLLTFCVMDAAAESRGWQAPAGHRQIPIWPGIPPDSRHMPGLEYARPAKDSLVAGKPWTEVSNVSTPTITLFPPKGANTGAAVVVFPGGGYYDLAMDLEGTEACEWLASIGITGVLLKYRVPVHHTRRNSGAYPDSPMDLEDAQRTIGLLRLHAKEWHLDVHKIGVLGFSAGGHLVAAISTHFKKRLYRPLDAADRLSCRPDFGVALYPGHLWLGDPKFKLNPNVPVTKDTPPQFLLQAEDDHVDSANDSLVYYIALKNAGVPAEIHLFPHGGHAFGLRPTKFPITRWPKLVQIWLQSMSVI